VATRSQNHVVKVNVVISDRLIHKCLIYSTLRVLETSLSTF
jgi:hypothetical protein